MTGFGALSHYSPWLVLAVGLLNLAGCAGAGLGLLRLVRLNLPSPWRQVAAVNVGTLAMSLSVQIVTFSGQASAGALIGLWLAVMLFGLGQGVGELRRLRLPTWFHPNRADWLALGIAGAANLLTLVVAVAPSTKIDELYYHMLLPARIVTDQGLVFYRLPWESAILPQMHYQIAAAPLHALQVPDAMNVTSWGLGLTLQGFAWCILRQRWPESPLAGFIVASFAVGMYPVVWFVTGGAHALGTLAAASAVTALLTWRTLLAVLSAGAFVALVSILALAAASTKATMVPFAVLAVALACWVARGPGWRRTLAGAALPWCVFFLPLLAWTHWQAGSPFGPMFAGAFGPSAYDVDAMRETLRQTRLVNQTSWSEVAKYALLNHPPQVWAGLLLLAHPALESSVRVLGMLIAGVQMAILSLFVQFDLRFFGGIEYGLTLGVLCAPLPRLLQLRGSKVGVTLVSGVLLLPWLGLQGYYAWQFVPVVVGAQRIDDFATRYLAFYRDFVELDQLLPPDAILLVDGSRLDAVYAPRPVYFDRADLPPGRPVYLFLVGAVDQSLSNATARRLVYHNPTATVITFRTPGRQPGTGNLQVFELVPTTEVP